MMNRACCWSGVVKGRLELKRQFRLLLGPEVLKDVHQASNVKLPRAEQTQHP